MLSIALFRLAKHDPCTAPFDRNFLGLPPNGTNNSQADTGHTPAISSNLASLFHRCIPPPVIAATRAESFYRCIPRLFRGAVQSTSGGGKNAHCWGVYPGRLGVLYSISNSCLWLPMVQMNSLSSSVVYPGRSMVLYSCGASGISSWPKSLPKASCVISCAAVSSLYTPVV